MIHASRCTCATKWYKLREQLHSAGIDHALVEAIADPRGDTLVEVVVGVDIVLGETLAEEIAESSVVASRPIRKRA